MIFIFFSKKIFLPILFSFKKNFLDSLKYFIISCIKTSMWLIIKADNKVEYMLEVFDNETLQSVTQIIQEMHPVRGEVQFTQIKGGFPLPLDKPLCELGLNDRAVLYVESLITQRIPKRSLSTTIVNKKDTISRSISNKI